MFFRRAWDLAPVYDYTIKSHLEAAKKAVAEAEMRSAEMSVRGEREI